MSIDQDEAMKIDERESGRELDALVAVKVMGMVFLDPENPPIHIPGVIPRYSTDIAAAWEVVEKIKATSSRGYVLDFIRGEWTVGSRSCGDAGEPELYDSEAGTAEEAPLAICRAALKAAL